MKRRRRAGGRGRRGRAYFLSRALALGGVDVLFLSEGMEVVVRDEVGVMIWDGRMDNDC